MTKWSHDISAAPRGKMVHSTRTVGDRVHEISDFVPDHIWAASKCGKVIKSYWIPPVGKAAGRWSGFATGEAPIAWQRFVVPEHPFQEPQRQQGTDGGEIAAVKVIDRLANAAGVEPSPSDHFILEDVGEVPE